MKKLPKAPLQEVIFELKWQLQTNAIGQKTDSLYSFALGKFSERLESEFPARVSKFPEGIPSAMMNYQASVQFWKEANTWPVVQIGPGILTVNDTEKNYVWEDNYYPLIKKAVGWLKSAYKELNLIGVSLRYIDVVKVKDYGYESWPDFVSTHLNFEFKNSFPTPGNLSNFQFDQKFNMNEIGELNIAMSSGLNNKQEEIFIWQTAINKSGKIFIENLDTWLEDAHECTSRVFKDICKNEFYESFR